MGDEGVLYCANHPRRETQLRCNRCGKLICPDCVIITPVGQRCRTCAALRPNPIYQVSLSYYARAWGAGLGVAIIGGILLLGILRFFPLLLAALLGYIVGEVVSWAANYRRGVGLQWAAGVSAGVGVAFGQLWPARSIMLDGAVSMTAKASLASRLILGDIWAWLLLFLAIFLAVYRLR